MRDLSAVTRVLLVGGCVLVALFGWWSFSHADDRPRFSAGYGSGAPPGARRFWGATTAVAAVAGAVIAVLR